MIIKKFNKFSINESNKYSDILEDIKNMINSTIESNGGEFNTFVESFIKDDESFKIEGLINDSDIYEFYLKWRNDIDEVLNDFKFFDEVPSKQNIFSLYEFIIKGTMKSIKELVKMINEKV